MRLPSNVLAKLYLTGVAITAACEPAHEPETCETKPIQPIIVEEQTMEIEPAVAPRYPESQHVQQPQPVIKKKPPKRKVWVSVCGHMELTDDEKRSMVDCGRG